MKVLKCFFLILLFSSTKFYPQSRTKIDCWEAHTDYNDIKFTENHYALIVKKDSIEIIINNIYKYNYKFHYEKGFKYLIINEEKMILKERSVNSVPTITINYLHKNKNKSVDEITTVEFKKCK